jgi:hypothetical protein
LLSFPENHKRKSAIALLCGIGLLGLFLCLHYGSHTEYSAAADASWRTGGKPMQARIHLRGLDGNPIAGAEVVIMDNSGQQNAVTNNGGDATLDMSEYDVEDLQVNGHSVLAKAGARWWGAPTATDGLDVDIVLKDLSKPPRADPLGVLLSGT